MQPKNTARVELVMPRVTLKIRAHASPARPVRPTRAALKDEHGPCANPYNADIPPARSVRQPMQLSSLAASCCSAHSRTSALIQSSNDASQKLIPYHICTKPSIQSLLESLQVPALKSQLNLASLSSDPSTPNSPQITTSELKSQPRRLQLIMAERRQRNA